MKVIGSEYVKIYKLVVGIPDRYKKNLRHKRATGNNIAVDKAKLVQNYI